MTRGAFLSYRRSDSAGHAGRLHDCLAARLGADRVFMDVGDIAPGDNFEVALERELGKADTVLVVIGREWLGAAAGGRRRLDDPADHHRIEIERALAGGIRLIPVLVEGAQMPAESDLPEALRPLARHQAIELRDSRWDDDVAALLRVVAPQAGSSGATASSGARMAAVASVAAMLLVAVAGYLLHTAQRPAAPAAGAPPAAAPVPAQAALGGIWRRENGSRWAFTAEGDGYRIEEIHYDSKQPWMGGRGELREGRLTFALDHLFGGNLRLKGSLTLAPDGRTLSGTATALPSGARQSVLLNRE